MPPHLVWSPVRDAYPGKTMTLKAFALILSGAVFSSFAGLLLCLVHQQGTPRVSTVGVWLRKDAPVYEVSFHEEIRPPRVPAGGGGNDVKDAPDPPARHWGDLLDLAPTPAPPEALKDLEDALQHMPGLLLSDSSDGKSSGGSGGGRGGGTGLGSGQGLGSNRDQQLQTARHRDGIPLKIEDMPVDHREIPLFPKLAKAAHLAGNVVVEVLVGEDGVPLKIDLVSSANPLFTEEVMRVMPLWRFKPVLADGERVRARVKVLFIFMYDEFPQAN
jgi:TonB family protein